MNPELCWRSLCWFENVKQWKPGYQGAVWLWHFRNYKAMYSRDRDAEMRELSA